MILNSNLIALSGAMMPGPLLTATISESVKRGYWSRPGCQAQKVGLLGILIFFLGHQAAVFGWSGTARLLL